MQVWDLGGQDSIRPYWRCYLPNTHAVIYVVDSCDTVRMSLSRSVLETLLNEDDLRGCSVLVLANKQDIPGALSEVQVADALGLKRIKDRRWTVIKTSAIEGEGVLAGLDWLASNMGE